MEVLTLLCHVALLATGFRLRQIDGITYNTYRLGPQLLVPAIRCVPGPASQAGLLCGTAQCSWLSTRCAGTCTAVQVHGSWDA